MTHHTLEERRRYAEKHSDNLRAMRRRWKANHAERNRAHGAVHKAIKRGHLVRPDRCENCGTAAPVEAHHWHGYGREHILDVQWLCHRCHVASPTPPNA